MRRNETSPSHALPETAVGRRVLKAGRVKVRKVCRQERALSSRKQVSGQVTCLRPGRNGAAPQPGW